MSLPNLQSILVPALRHSSHLWMILSPAGEATTVWADLQLIINNTKIVDCAPAAVLFKQLALAQKG